MTQSVFSVTAAPPDSLFALVAKCKEDTHPNKVDLSIGAYRDDNGKPWVLPVVQKADKIVSDDPNLNHEYLPIAGLADFRSRAAAVVFGKDASVLKDNKVASVQTISGTGANHLAAVFLRAFAPSGGDGTVYIPDPTWANHKGIFSEAGLKVKVYPYYDNEKKKLKFDELIEALKKANAGDVVLLHACAHNPTGYDPTQEQWKQIAKVVQEKKLFPLFDSAYQGFATGDLDRDAWSIRHFASLGLELAVCQSFSKNFGLYGERAGNLHVLVETPELAKAVESQLAAIERAEISNPPAYGARIVAKALGDDELYKLWCDDLVTMSTRILSMRKALKESLIKLGTPGTWDHIVDQIGMFSYTGLSKTQCEHLVDDFHIYLPTNGRISVAGLNTHNVEYVAKSIDAVVRKY